MNRDQLIALDKKYIWHPYTPMSEYIHRTNPLVIERAEGARLYDVDGRSYLDGNASWWTCLLGHGHPRLVRALKTQAETLCHTSLAGVTHAPAAELAEALIRVAPPGLSKVFFSDNGSTAVESALKLSLQYFQQTGRPRKRLFLSLQGAFHGETLGVTALGGVDVFRAPFASTLMDCVHLELPTPESLPSTGPVEFPALAAVLEQRADEIAALCVEPLVQGAGGMRMYDPRILSKARELTAKHDVLLIVDEVFTGYGRTGPMWACQHVGVTPDILCTAKGLSGGMLPMAATLTSERVFEGFLGEASRAFYYGHTYCGNPLGARVALEVLRVYEEERVLEAAAGKARRIAETFANLGRLKGVEASRSLGMIGALNLSGQDGYLDRAGWRVYAEALQRGAYIRPLGNVVYITPALTISDADLEELLLILEQSVISVTEGLSPSRSIEAQHQT